MSSRSSMVPTAVGARFGTTTRKLCCAMRPPGSLAIIVTTAVPGDTAVTVTVLPVPATVATPGSDDEVAKVSRSSSLGSSKQALTVADSPTWMVSSGIVPHEAGGWGS